MNVPSYCSAGSGRRHAHCCGTALTRRPLNTFGRELKVCRDHRRRRLRLRALAHPPSTSDLGVSRAQSLFTLFKFVSRREKARGTVATFANSLDASPVAPSLTRTTHFCPPSATALCVKCEKERCTRHLSDEGRGLYSSGLH